MFFKKKIILLTFFLIIIVQTLLFTNNNQKTSFRYFKWTVQEVSIGKLISISFFSGLIISTIINTTLNSFNKNTFKNIEEKFKPFDDGEDIKSDVEMPPQRDIRDAQPTISVNYRVIKNIEEKNFKKDQNISKNNDKGDDWGNDDNDW